MSLADKIGELRKGNKCESDCDQFMKTLIGDTAIYAEALNMGEHLID